jgi:general secretion pathway protein K
MVHKAENQRGTAIFMALFFVVLATSLSVYWFQQTRLAVKRTQLLITFDRLYLDAQEILDLEIALLRNTPRNPAIDKATTWPILVNEITAEDGAILRGQIEDYQGRININNLADPNTQAAFIRLLTALNLVTDVASGTQLANNIIAWITVNKLQSPAMQTINAVYTSHTPPFAAAEQDMRSISELRLVEGITGRIYSILEPYLCALPPKTPIHFKHAPAAVVQAYNLPLTTTTETVSEFYLTRADVQFQKNHFTLYTLLHLNQQMEVEIIWQSRDTV